MDSLVKCGGGFVLETESEPRAQPAAHPQAGLTTSGSGDRLVEEGGPGLRTPLNFVLTG